MSTILLGPLMAAPAAAHGSVINPPSRNYGCWQRWGNDFQNPAMATQDPMCWQAWQADSTAMWNWNSLYREGVAGNHQAAIPDGQLCSGGQTGGTRYAALDSPGAWRATSVPNNFTLTVHDQARHGADYFIVYVTRQGFDPLTQRLRWSDLEQVVRTGRHAPGAGSTTSDPVLNGVSINIPVNAPGRTGRHVVYTIWQASHSDQSYYWCSDVIFGGGGTGTSSTTTTTTRPSTTTRSTSTTTTTSTTRPTSTSTTRSTATTVTSTTSSSPQPTGAGACTATYRTVNSWGGGYQGEVTVRNNGTSAISGWSVALTLPSGSSVAQIWSGTLTGSGNAVTVRNAGYNGTVAPSASTSFGFIGSGAAGAPTVSCAAG